MPDNEKEVWTYSSAVGLLLSLLPVSAHLQRFMFS